MRPDTSAAGWLHKVTVIITGMVSAIIRISIDIRVNLCFYQYQMNDHGYRPLFRLKNQMLFHRWMMPISG